MFVTLGEVSNAKSILVYRIKGLYSKNSENVQD